MARVEIFPDTRIFSPLLHTGASNIRKEKFYLCEAAGR